MVPEPERDVVVAEDPRGGARHAIALASRLARNLGRPVRVMPWPHSDLAAVQPEPALVVKVAEPSWRGGSPDRRLLRALRCPVLLLPGGPPPCNGAVMAVVLLEGEGASESDRVVLAVASTIAACRGQRLHVVHAWSAVGASVLRCRLRGVGPKTAGRFIAAVADERHRRLCHLVDGARIDAAGATVAEGPLKPTVLRAAMATDASVLVATRRWLGGLAGLVQQSPADALLGAPGQALLSVTDDDGGLCGANVLRAVPA